MSLLKFYLGSASTLEIQPDRPKAERFATFIERLRLAPRANNFEEAYGQLVGILNDVENSMTSIPYNPAKWETDGRMYPPQIDSIRKVAGHPLLHRFRSLQHNTYIGEIGAIEVQELHADDDHNPHTVGAQNQQTRTDVRLL